MFSSSHRILELMTPIEAVSAAVRDIPYPSVWIALAVLWVLSSVSGGRRRSRVRTMLGSGAAGERKVTRAIAAAGLPAVHDVLLPVAGTVTQIDHVAATGRGLLVIETKNFSGLVFGAPKDTMWTQISGKKAKRRFQNPLLQNRLHERAVCGTGCPDVSGLVVFTGSATFPKGMPVGTVRIDDLPAYLAASGRPDRSDRAALDEVRRTAVRHDTRLHRRMHAAAVARHR